MGKRTRKKLRAGKEYELFVYEKLKAFYRDGDVRHNDFIFGHESGLNRQIDVSIRLQSAAGPLLFIVQTKDYAKRKADITKLGEFSSVMQDVEASKGILMCTAGFARSNRQYALCKGIELLTIEDVESDKWHTDVQIPIIFNKYGLDPELHVGMPWSPERARLDGLGPVPLGLEMMVSSDGGQTAQSVRERVDAAVAGSGNNARDGGEFHLGSSGTSILLNGIWVPVDALSISLSVTRRVFLKYVIPEKYAQVRDHVRNEITPLGVAVRSSIAIDDTWLEISEDDVPVTAGFSFEIDEWV